MYTTLLKRSMLSLCFLVTGTLVCLQPSSAAEPRKAEMDWNKPIAVATIASVDRVMGDIEYLFSTVEKPEYPAMIKGFLAQYRDLAGLDRTKPLGAFVFLKEGISPQPTVVGFVPVKSMEELTKTLGDIGLTLAAVEGKKDRYTLALPRFSLHIKMAHGYAFIQLKSEALDREFYNPADFTSALAKKYDIAGSALLSNIPAPMRVMAVDLLRARMDEELERKPGEDDIEYLSRKETILFLLKQFEIFSEDGESLTIGYALSQEKKKILFDLGIKATPDSKLANEFKSLSEITSQYSYLDAKSAPFLGYGIVPLRKEVEQKTLLELLEKQQTEIPPVLLGDETNPGPVAKILESVKATIRSGKLDGQLQMQETTKGKPALVASLKLTEGAVFKEGLEALFKLMMQAEDTQEIKANVADIDGVIVHQISPKGIGKKANDFFGENSVVFVGCGPDECWIAMGQKEALDLLKTSISVSQTQSAQKKPGSSFLLSLKFAELIPLMEDTTKDPEFIESAKIAFEKGGDLISFYPHITANQASLSLELGEGFIRLVSLAIVNRK